MLKKKSLMISSFGVALMSLTACSGGSSSSGSSDSTNVVNNAPQSYSTPSTSESKLSNTHILKYDDYQYSEVNAAALRSFTGDALWASNLDFVGVTNDVAVVNTQDNNNYYYGVDLKTGKQKWKLNLTTPVGVSNMSSGTFNVNKLGNILVASWGGSITNNTIKKVSQVSYAQGFDINTGRKVGEIKINGSTSINSNNIYASFSKEGDDDQTGTNAKVFYSDGLTSENFDNGPLINLINNNNKRTFKNEIRTSTGKGIINYTEANGPLNVNYYQGVDTKTHQLIGQPVKCDLDESASNAGILQSISPSGNKLIYDNMEVDSHDPSNIKCLNSLSDNINFKSIDDDGNILAQASNSNGASSWVYIKNNSNKMEPLDTNVDSLDAILTKDYLIKKEQINYSESTDGESIWDGQLGIFTRKNI